MLVSREELEQYGITHEQLIDNLATIVKRNVESGRAMRVMTQGGHRPGSLTMEQLERYIDIVLKFYLIEFKRLDLLAARDEDEWAQLLDRLTYRARGILRRFNMSSDPADFALQACETIFLQWFPCDVCFDAWSMTILRNHVLWPRMRSRDLIDRDPTVGSLDHMDNPDAGIEYSLYETLPDHAASADFECIETRQMLVDAIDLLPSEEQKVVIIHQFFNDLNDEEIARELDKTRQAVYNLRHRALRGLGEILASWHSRETAL